MVLLVIGHHRASGSAGGKKGARVSDVGPIIIVGILMLSLAYAIWLLTTGAEQRARLIIETQRQRAIIEAQERELNQWRREYGTLTNDAVWWQEEIG